MKDFKLIYNEQGYLNEPIQTDEFYVAAQESNSVSISATFPGMLVGSVKAYVEFPGGGDIIECEKLTVNNHTATATLSSDYLRYHYLLMGFEVDTGTKQIRFEPVTLEVDKFVNPTGSASPSAYTVTVKIGNVTELEPGETPFVTNTGTDKNPVLDFGIPRGEKGDKGEQGIQGIQGVQGNAGYTPVKGIDYFTPEDIKSLGIDDKADNEYVANVYTDLEAQLMDRVEKVEGMQLSAIKFINLGALGDSQITERLDDFKSFGMYHLTYDETTTYGVGQALMSVHGNVDEGIVSQTLYRFIGGVQSDILYRHYYEDEGVWDNWKAQYLNERELRDTYATKTALDEAIGDVEASLENIIQKYGLGGDAQ